MVRDGVKTYRSEIAAAVHETVEGMHDAGVVDKQTMLEFDASYLHSSAMFRSELRYPSDSL